MSPDPITALQRTDAHGRSRWVTLLEPGGTLEAHTPSEVIPVLREILAARKNGWNAAGWISYEAAAGFDPHLSTHPPLPGNPLLRFRLFRTCADGLPKMDTAPFTLHPLRPSLSEQEFSSRVEEVRAAIGRGETYQVNLTYPWTSSFSGCPRSLFRQIRFGQSGRHQAYLEEEDRILISASPERFFRLENGRIQCRPMKGTARPGEEIPLQDSKKDRAENVMIVDMIRNDLGQVATPGSVKTPGLFEIEPYPSLIQMTSTVTAEGPDDPLPWLRACFPCASITGAPKRNTMEWIRRLESGPRGVYTGCIGGFYADGVTEFNVAIRTLQIDRKSGAVTYGTGCGVVWDSDPVREYQESVLKTAVLTHADPEVQLIETMRGEPGSGILNRNRHLERLTSSAHELGYELDVKELDSRLDAFSASLTAPSKVRLTLSPSGQLQVTVTPLPDPGSSSMTFRLDSAPTSSLHPELRHKTTKRSVYENARSRHPDVDETLLINERGECMEFCIGNLVIEKNGTLLTPPLHSGLLPGTFRTELVQNGLREQVITPQDLEKADAVYLTNAVRGKVRMKWIR